MKFEDVKNLIKLIQENDISEVEIEEPNLRIRISRNAATESSQGGFKSSIFHAHATPTATADEVKVPQTEAVSGTDTFEEDRFKKVYAPLVGTLYRSPSPDSEPFVKQGDVIEKGAVICIIEAMKVMNEIESEHAGRIVALPVENGTPVEYGEPICIIDPFA